MSMPDTKSGRERKGLNKEAQLEARLARREVRTLETDDEPMPFDRDEVESEYLTPQSDVRSDD